MIRRLAALMLLLVPVQVFAADDGITKRESPHSVPQTLDRLEAVLKERGITVFARIDHADGAAKVGLVFRPRRCSFLGILAQGRL